MADGWRHVDLERDDWLVFPPEGPLAGYASVEDLGAGRVHADGYVHPELRDIGVGTRLAELSEQRARELASRRVAPAREVS